MRSWKAAIIPWMGLTLAFSSCALLFPDRIAPKSSDYIITPPSAPWTKLQASNEAEATEAMKADLAYENPVTGAIISLNSLCRKYQSSTLESLTNNLVRGIDNREIVEKKEVTLDGQNALDTLFSGEVDRVALKIRTVVMIKGSCTYDFLHVYVPKKDSSSGGEFDAFLASFRTPQ